MAKEAAPDPQGTFDAVSRLVRQLAPDAYDCRIAYRVPGGGEGTIPVSMPPDPDASDIDQAIGEVCGRLRPGDRLRGKAIAAECDREFDSYFREALSRCVKKGRIHRDAKGYGPQTDALSSST